MRFPAGLSPDWRSFWVDFPPGVCLCVSVCVCVRPGIDWPSIQGVFQSMAQEAEIGSSIWLLQNGFSSVKVIIQISVQGQKVEFNWNSKELTSLIDT